MGVCKGGEGTSLIRSSKNMARTEVFVGHSVRWTRGGVWGTVGSETLNHYSGNIPE